MSAKKSGEAKEAEAVSTARVKGRVLSRFVFGKTPYAVNSLFEGTKEQAAELEQSGKIDTGKSAVERAQK